MNAEELSKIIKNGMTEQVEFKNSNLSINEVARTVCAFLNRKGGRILIGFSDKGKPTGISDVSSFYHQLETELQKMISPSTFWSVEQAEDAGKDFIIVDVPEGMDKPYVVDGAIYIRAGIKDVPATRDDISTLIHKRAEAEVRWERQVAIGTGLEDLEKDIIVETAQLAVNSERWKGKPKDIESFLHSFGLLVSGSLTKAALILYGKNPTRFFPQAKVRLMVMPNGKIGRQYSMDKEFDGGLLRITQEIQDSLAIYVGGTNSTFSAQNWQRSDRQSYSLPALREGVMNALVHRDYESNGSILISVLPDSIKIANPGSLPEGLKVTDLKKNHLSFPRNPDIAHMCFLHRLIEKVGRGTQFIVENCRNAQLKDPKWVSSSLETSLVFFSSLNKAGTQDLSERQKKIIEVLKSRKNMKATEIVILLGIDITDRTIRNDLDYLIRQGLVMRNGQGPSTTYLLENQDSK
ncbi:MAG TPA: putative DNA binding domain-containing protein [bacterium]|nr:putative DNA binding domain-containing protein [bacterium]HPS29550.1 putative DNA binding domain-containing protein [bacterium]